ncbi:hypothetical protein D039_2255B, partial [Vibrio parahaemolyticus EKP-028]
RMGCHFCYM